MFIVLRKGFKLISGNIFSLIFNKCLVVRDVTYHLYKEQ